VKLEGLAQTNSSNVLLIGSGSAGVILLDAHISSSGLAQVVVETQARCLLNSFRSS